MFQHFQHWFYNLSNILLNPFRRWKEIDCKELPIGSCDLLWWVDFVFLVVLVVEMRIDCDMVHYRVDVTFVEWSVPWHIFRPITSGTQSKNCPSIQSIFWKCPNVSESLVSLTHFASLQNTEEKGHRGRTKSFHLDGGADPHHTCVAPSPTHRDIFWLLCSFSRAFSSRH